MKISKNTLLLLGAVGLGISCFIGANYYFRTYLSQAESRLAGNYQPRKVMVAKVALAAGASLSADNLAVRSIPSRYLGSTALGPEEFDLVDGQRIMVGLQPGDPIDRGALERSDHAALSNTVAKGERAITFPVDEISSISGMLVPGDIIDLLFTGPGTTANSYDHGGDAGQERETKDLLHVRPLLQAVTVMATGKTTQKRKIRSEDGSEREVDMAFSTVTLKVSPNEAEQILIAQKVGQLTAVLRNPDDKARLKRIVLDEAAFKLVDPAPPPAPGRFIEMIIGGSGKVGGMRMKAADAGDLLAAVLNAAPRNGVAAASPPPASPPPLAPADVHGRLGIDSPPPAHNAKSVPSTKP